VGRNLRSEIDAAMEAAAQELEEPGAKSAPKRKVPQAPAPSGLPKAGTGQTGANIPAMPANTDGRSGARTLPPPPNANLVKSAPAAPANTDGRSGARKLPTSPARSESIPGPNASFPGVSKSSLPASRNTLPPGATPPGITPAPVPKAQVTGSTPPRPTIPPIGQGKSQKTPTPKRADQIRGVSKIELIDYGPDDSLIDHKGRSKPLYKPRSKRPSVWRPKKPIRILLGLFPGTRLMALESVREGAPYSALGLFALIGSLFLMLGWSRMESAMKSLLIDDRWILAHAAALVTLLLLYELLRLASFFEEKTSGLKVPRVLAAFLLPSVAILVLGPYLVSVWPQLVEAAWFAAVVLAFGAIAGSVWCAFDGTLSTPRGKRIFRITGLVVALALAGGLIASNGALKDTLRALAATAQAHGFRTLPELLTLLM
jgi:hypothetical protein